MCALSLIHIYDALSALPDRGDRPFTVLDFGCGKSYLTFVLYHYFTRVRGLPVRMVGLDLKQDVITRCNETARRYGYDGLRFELGEDVYKRQGGKSL